MKIHVLTNAVDCGDAVSTHCLLLLDRARELNIPASLYAEFHHEALSARVTPLDKLLSQAEPGDVLLHQLFNETSLMPYVEQFPGKRVLMYHNITPAEFFAPDTPVFESCNRGLRLVKTLPPLYDLALGMSEFSRQDLEQLGYRNTGVFPLLMDLEHRPRTRLPPSRANSITRFLFVGRIAPNKGIHHLLKFVRAYRDLGRTVSCTLVGNQYQHPDYKERLLSLAHDLQLSIGKEIILRGKISDAERDACYSEADAFVCYSEHEGFCAPLIESMAMGLPTFALNRAACGATIGSEAGLFENLDFAANARMVRDILEDSARRKALLQYQVKRVEAFSPLCQRTAIQQMLAEVARTPPRLIAPRTVSVVINTYNRGWHLDRCLRSLQHQSYKDFEVVIVNGPSTDDTEARLKSWEDKVRVVLTNSRVLSVSRNEGIAAANGELVAFIDDDAVAHPSWLAELVPAFQDPDVGGVGGLVYRMNGGDVEFANGILDPEGTVKWDQPAPGFHWHWAEGFLNTVSGNNCIFRRTGLDAIGGFDERIEYYHDEADVVMRLDIAGLRTVHRPRAIVYHEAAGSHNRKSRYNLNWFVILKNTLYVALKNYRGTDRHALARRIVQQLVRQRMRPPVDWWSSKEITFSEFVGIESGCIRGIAIGLSRGLNAPPLLRKFEGPAGAIQPFPARSSSTLSVCLLTQNLPEKAPGGIATYTMALAKGLRDAGVSVHVISRGDSLAAPELREGVWHHQASEVPLEEATQSLSDFPTATKNLLYANGARLKVYEIQAAFGLDLVEAPSWDFEGVLLAMDKRLPVVVRWHSPLFKVMETQSWPSTPDLDLCCELEHMQGRYADAASGSTEGILSSVSAKYSLDPDKTALIPLGLEIEAPAKAVSPTNGHHPGITVLFVGRLEKRKGIHTLFDALPQVLSRFGDVTVDIAGSDSRPSSGERSWAERWAALYPGLRHRVRFHGELPASGLESLYKKCDLFVAPSLYESFGLIYLEAMAHGKPVIGTRAGGIPEVVLDGETGLLIEPGDSDALATAMIRLLQNPEFRAELGAAGKTRFQTEFSATVMAKRTIRFYSDVAHEWFAQNKPVWQAGPVDVVKHPSTHIDWLPTSGSLWLVAGPGEPRSICYGPYMHLAPGTYRVEFMLNSEGPVDPETRVAVVDVFNMAYGYKEEQEIHGRDFSGMAISVALFFTVPDDVTGTFEYRVHTTGKTTLSVRGIVVRSWPPRSLRTTATPPAWSWTSRKKQMAQKVMVR